MMKWNRVIFYGPKAQLDSKRLTRAMKHKRWIPSVYLVVSATDRDNKIEIYETPQLAQPVFAKREFLVLGVAVGYGEAMDLVCTIVDDIYRSTGGINVEEYLRKQ